MNESQPETSSSNTRIALSGFQSLPSDISAAVVYTARYRLCTCGTGVHCPIQTMYLWDKSTLHNTDYVLVGREYTAPYRLYTCGTQVHCTIQTVNPWERVHCTIQTKHLWDRSTLHHTDYALVGQRYTAPYRLCTCGTLVHCTT